MMIHVDFSPFNEMITSIHVIQNPSHHPYRKAWAERAIKKLPPDVLLTIKDWGPYFYETSSVLMKKVWKKRSQS